MKKTIEVSSDKLQYTEFVETIKQKIKVAKNRTVLSVNRQLMMRYFEIAEGI